MRIAHVFKDASPPLVAGITCYISDVSAAMVQRGHDVEIHVAGVRISRQDRLPSGAVVRRHREYARLLSMPLAPGLVAEVVGSRADVIHVHLPNPIGEIGAVLNRSSAVVCTFHAQLGRQRWLEAPYGLLRRRLFDRAHRILVASEAMASGPELVRHGSKTLVLPYGVSPRLSFGTPHRDVEREPDLLRLLFVGRLVYYKGVEVVLHAIGRVPGAILTVIGDGVDRARLEEIASKLGISERTRFVGTVSDGELARAFSEADVFVLPSVSRAEAFGLAMAEAMAAGVPAISTSLGTGTDWVNIDGETGLVVTPGSVGALADAIVRLRDSQLRETMGRSAMERAQAVFSFERHVAVLEDVYRSA